MENEPDPEQPNIDPAQLSSNEELLRRLIRLVVGIILVGQDALRQQLPQWEAQAAKYLEEHNQTIGTETGPESFKDPTQATQGQASWFPKAWEHRAVGLAFESPRYVRAGIGKIWQANRQIWKKTAPLRLPLDLLGITAYTRDWFEVITEQIRADADRLEEIGAAESQASRALGQVALQDGLDRFLERLAKNPEVQELVQVQTTSLTTEVVEEIRERTVSADNLIEAIVRRILRQPARKFEKFVPNPPVDTKKP